jgi:glutamine amidotransferase PdxT
MGESNTMKKIAQKLKWLKGIVHKSVTKNKDKSMYLACMGMMLFVEGLEEGVEKKEYPTEEELTKCNEILKLLQHKYGYDIDWKMDIESMSV